MDGFQPWMVGGLLVAQVGIAALASHVIRRLTRAAIRTASPLPVTGQRSASAIFTAGTDVAAQVKPAMAMGAADGAPKLPVTPTNARPLAVPHETEAWIKLFAEENHALQVVLGYVRAVLAFERA